MTTPGAILLYHGLFQAIPVEFGSRLHNVTPTEFERQITLLKAHFDLISADEWMRRTDKTGAFAITFDDGYRTAVEEASKILIRHGIPGTFFLNGAVLNGGIFWRDRVRRVIAAGLVVDFMAFLAVDEPRWAAFPESDFYDRTKDPRVHSGSIEAALLRFEAARSLAPLAPRAAAADELVDHPLMSYGNHTFNHYMLAALPPDELAAEIGLGRRAIEALPISRARRSDILAFPFGGVGDAGRPALEAAAAAGHSAAVYATGGNAVLPDSCSGVALADRLIAPPTADRLAAMLRGRRPRSASARIRRLAARLRLPRAR